MKQLILNAVLVGMGAVIGALSSDNTKGIANAQFRPQCNQVMLSGIGPSSVTKDGSSRQATDV